MLHEKNKALAAALAVLADLIDRNPDIDWTYVTTTPHDAISITTHVHVSSALDLATLAGRYSAPISHDGNNDGSAWDTITINPPGIFVIISHHHRDAMVSAGTR